MLASQHAEALQCWCRSSVAQVSFSHHSHLRLDYIEIKLHFRLGGVITICGVITMHPLRFLRDVPGLTRAIGLPVFELQQVFLLIYALEILRVEHVTYGALGCSVILVLLYSLSLLHLAAHDLRATINALK